MAVIRVTSQDENGRLDKLQERYLGKRVLKERRRQDSIIMEQNQAMNCSGLFSK